jgi:hypothetical protein
LARILYMQVLTVEEMNNLIEVSCEEPFAKGQNSRDLQVCYDAADVETQFMDAIDSAYDFFRLLQVFNAKDSKQSTEVI